MQLGVFAIGADFSPGFLIGFKFDSGYGNFVHY